MAFSSSSSSSLSANPNVTPLIDVLLVLLIIFMTIVPLSPRGLDTLIPQASQAPSQTVAPAPIILEVRRLVPSPGGVSYRLQGRDLDRDRLRSSLRAAKAHSASGLILIGGDPALDYQPVVTAISEAQQAGFGSIGFLPRSRSPQP